MPTRQASILLPAMFLCLSGVLRTQSMPPQVARHYTMAHQSELTQQFSDFLAIPNVAADPAGLQRNADFLLSALKSRGLDARLLSVPGAPPVVFGQVITPGAAHTIVFYAHYDGQPVTPSEWTIPPFQPVVQTMNGEARMFARSAGDDRRRSLRSSPRWMH